MIEVLKIIIIVIILLSKGALVILIGLAIIFLLFILKELFVELLQDLKSYIFNHELQRRENKAKEQAQKAQTAQPQPPLALPGRVHITEKESPHDEGHDRTLCSKCKQPLPEAKAENQTEQRTESDPCDECF